MTESPRHPLQPPGVGGRRVFDAPRQMEGGGFEVARPFPSMALPDMDPFLLFDHWGPKTQGPGEAVGAPDHPHRGFETVTYVLAGESEHRDSHGHHGILRAGDVQWMTAGSGVVHSEMPSDKFQSEGGESHGIQLWVNLPAKDKMMAPRYQDVPADAIPRAELPGGWVKVISGTFRADDGAETSAVIDTVIPIQYLHLHSDDGATATATIPDGHNGFAVVLTGSATVDGETASADQIVLLPPGERTVSFDAGAAGDVAILSGPPLREPVARYGPFVMNTREEIYQAVRDFQSGKFGTIPPATA